MAHKKPLPKRECQQSGCNSKAKYDVLTNRNNLVGEYCTEHADKKVETVNRMEKDSLYRKNSLQPKDE